MRSIRIFFATLLLLLPAASPLSRLSAQQAPSEEALTAIWSPGLGFFGVRMSQSLAKDLKLERNAGMFILAVVKDGPADKAGIKRGDQMIGLTPVEAWNQKDKQATIKVLRAGKELSREVKSGEAGISQPLSEPPPAAADRKPVQYTVDPQGAGDFRTLTAALYRALPGDSIVLQAGTYRETVLFPSGVSLRAAQKGLARVESSAPWLFLNVADAEISGITFSGNGFLLANAKNFKLSESEFQKAGEKTIGISMVQSEAVSISHCAFRGVGQEAALDASSSRFRVADSVISGSAKAAIQLEDGSKAEVINNLMEGNPSGIIARASELTASGNIFTGTWTPEEKAQTFSVGILLQKSNAVVSKNSIRRAASGVYVGEATTTTKIAENTVTQSGYGITLLSSPATVTENLVLQNRNDGIFVGTLEKEGAEKKAEASPAPAAAPAKAPEVALVRNTVSENEGAGVRIEKSMLVNLRENLIEGNGLGIGVDDSPAAIENNTVVLQRFTGIFLGQAADVKLYNNIVAFNSYGLFADIGARRESGYNDVYGNLASTEFPLRDGNYGRSDRYTTRDGKKVPLDIYPAYDLKAATDLSVDPGFVKMGSDYTLKANSALARARGKGQRHIGAYAPPARAAVAARKPS